MKDPVSNKKVYQDNGRYRRTVEGPEVPPRLSSRGPFENPAVLPEHRRVKRANRSNDDIKQNRDCENEKGKEVLGLEFGLPIKERDGQAKRDEPKRKSIGLDQLFSCVQIVVEASEPGSDFETCGDEEPPNSTNASDENVSWDETNHVSKSELPHTVKDEPGKHRTQCVRRYGSCDNCIRVISPNQARNSASHTMEERHYLDLLFISERSSLVGVSWGLILTYQLRSNATLEYTGAREC